VDSVPVSLHVFPALTQLIQEIVHVFGVFPQSPCLFDEASGDAVASAIFKNLFSGFFIKLRVQAFSQGSYPFVRMLQVSNYLVFVSEL
jgi:hypothetical protein